MSFKDNYPLTPPTLSLDFVNSATIDPRVTFSRSSKATYYNPAGLLTVADVNVPRIDYDPITHECKGLLIEESRTNLLTYSEQFDNEAWIKANSTITTNGAVSPDNTNTADKLVENTANTEHYLDYVYAVTSGATYAFSTYYKAAEKTSVRMRTAISTPDAFTQFNLATGQVENSSHGAGNYSIVSVGAGWYRCSVIFTANATGNIVTRTQLTTASQTIYVGDGVSGVYLWGAQLEAGSFPTSYIPTTSAQVTRTADNASMTGTNFSSWYNQSEGTFSVNIDSGNTANALDTSGSARGALYVSGGTTTNRYRIGALVTTYIVTSGGVLSADISAGTLAANTNYKLASTYAVNSYQFANNGLLATEDTSGALPIGVNQMQLGLSGLSTGYLNGHIQSIKYYPIRLTNAQLQTLTNP